MNELWFDVPVQAISDSRRLPFSSPVHWAAQFIATTYRTERESMSA